MSKRWLMNEDIYILHWCVNGIEVGRIASDLGRSEASIQKRMAYLNSTKGDIRRRIAEKIHGECRIVARKLVALDEMGLDVGAWLDNEYPVNDFNAARMPEYFHSDMPSSSKDSEAA